MPSSDASPTRQRHFRLRRFALVVRETVMRAACLNPYKLIVAGSILEGLAIVLVYVPLGLQFIRHGD